jgi:hypothetical protein
MSQYKATTRVAARREPQRSPLIPHLDNSTCHRCRSLVHGDAANRALHRNLRPRALNHQKKQ